MEEEVMAEMMEDTMTEDEVTLEDTVVKDTVVMMILVDTNHTMQIVEEEEIIII